MKPAITPDPELTRGFSIGRYDFFLSFPHEKDETAVFTDLAECPVLVTDHLFTIEEGMAFIFGVSSTRNRTYSQADCGWDLIVRELIRENPLKGRADKIKRLTDDLTKKP